MGQKIVATHLIVKAMRDSGYKNAAYALAELIDNSIQADASDIKLVCVESSKGPRKRHLSKIAVIDNGMGMDKDTLELSLGFGNGTHLNATEQKGIGKFGMGLPNSSISQCRKVEVYTWQNGGNTLYSYLDLDEIENNKELEDVPSPIEKDIPDEFKKYVNSKSGTLILWTKIDKCMWQTAKSIFKHSELLIGRMYRYFIQDNKVTIKMIAKNEIGLINLDKDVFKSNDPIYLMDQTSCPAPYDNAAMFEKWGREDEYKFTVEHDGENHEIVIKFTSAKAKSREFTNPGSHPHGKHAQQNIGVSIVRAQRELELATKWATLTDPTERWWGVEVNFPPSLDEVFGVANNKQSARHFTADLADIEESLYEGQTFNEYMNELKEVNDPSAILIEIALKIKSTIKEMKKQTVGKTTPEIMREIDNPNPNSAENIATLSTEQLKQDGGIGESDEGESWTDDIKEKEIAEVLEDADIEEPELVAAKLVSSGEKYIFQDGDIEGDSFFSVKAKGGKIMIILNKNHPVYPKLFQLLEKDGEKSSDVLAALKLIIMAWARYEDQSPEDLKVQVQESRADWGRIAKRFLNNKE